MKEKGNFGESIAVKYLLDNGFKILDKNWYYDHKEIDIVAQEGDQIVFVEVKYRDSNLQYSVFDVISNRKIRNILDAAEAYINKNDITLEARFDVIGIITKNHKQSLEHIRDAFNALSI